MLSFIFAVILLGLALCTISIRKTYYALPLAELKRRAEKRDSLAVKLYPAVAYQNSLRGLLWLLISLTSAGGFILLTNSAPVWLSFIALVAVLWAGFSWLPASRTTALGTRMTLLVTPVFVWLLNYLHPILSRTVSLAQKRYTAVQHTGLFERSDVLALVERQQKQPDNRLSPETLEIITRALQFDDYKVRDILTPRSEVTTIYANEVIGPILIDELHQTNQEHVLVQDGDKPKSASKKDGQIIGSLEVGPLGLHSSGTVRESMDATVYYVHENDSLSEALHAFFVTNHPLFVVVNSFEEFVGIITVQNILHQLLGHVPGDDFDQYADVAAVAQRHSAHKTADLEPAKSPKAENDDEDIIEVIE